MKGLGTRELGLGQKNNKEISVSNEIRSYRDLVAWQKAIALSKRVYGATKLFPKEETYGLVQQIRRAVVSIPSNIAEGYGRGGRMDYIRFLYMARGSLYEVETHTLISRDLGYLTDKQADSLLGRCGRVFSFALRPDKESKNEKIAGRGNWGFCFCLVPNP